MPTPSRNSEGPAGNVAVDSAKRVAIESVRNVYFEDQRVTLGKSRLLKDGEVLVDIAGAPDIAETDGSITKSIAALCDEARRIGVKKGSAIKEVITTVGRECPVRILRATTICPESIEGGSIRTQ